MINNTYNDYNSTKRFIDNKEHIHYNMYKTYTANIKYI